MKNLSLSLLFFLICSAWSVAQDKWLSYPSQEAITDFVETEEELLLTTSNGLVKMNKYTFEKVHWTVDNTALPSRHIQTITLDDQKNSWIGTYDGVIARVGPTGFTDLTGIPPEMWDENEKLLTLEIDHNDVKWIGTTKGLFRFDGVYWSLYNQSTVPGNTSLADVWSIQIDEHNLVSLASLESFQFDGNTWTNLSEGTNLFSYDGAQLYTDAAGNLWWTNYSNAIGRYDGTSWTEYLDTNPTQWSPSQPDTDFKGINQAPDGTMMLYTASAIYHLIDEVWTLQDNAQVSEINRPIDHFFYDQDDNSWLTAGIYVSKKTPTTFSEISIGVFPIQSNEIKYFAEASDGTVYIANHRNHIATYQDGVWAELNTDILRAENPFLQITDLAIGNANQLYVGTPKGLFEYNNGNWTRYHVDNNNAAFSIVRKLAVAPNGTLWIAADQEGMFRFQDNVWQQFNASNSLLLTAENIQDLVIDQDNIVWAYSQEKILYRVEQEAWTSIDLNQIMPTANLSNGMYADKNNQLWIATWNEGLFRFDGNQWKQFSTATTSMDSDQIYSITSDADGRLYLGTGFGLSTFDGNEWKNYNENNGPFYESNVVKQVFASSDGTAWMSVNYQGLVVFNLAGFNPVSTFTPKSNEILQFEVAPNPARDQVRLTYHLAHPTPIQLEIWDVQGKLYLQETHTFQTKGNQQLNLELGTLPRGLYFVQIKGRDQLITKKLVLTK